MKMIMIREKIAVQKILLKKIVLLKPPGSDASRVRMYGTWNSQFIDCSVTTIKSSHLTTP